MTPYRVLVEDDKGYQTILVSMLSKDRKTGERRIFIIQKPLSLLTTNTYEDKRRLAHLMANSWNSFIEDKYKIQKNDEGTGYTVYDPDGSTLPLDYYIQSDCLIGALRDFIQNREKAHFHVVDVL